METLRERKGAIVSTEDVNQSETGEYEDEAEPRRREVRIGLCGVGNRFSGVAVVVVGCPSDAYAVEGAVYDVL